MQEGRPLYLLETNISVHSMLFYDNIVEIHTLKIHNVHIYLILDISASNANGK